MCTARGPFFCETTAFVNGQLSLFMVNLTKSHKNFDFLTDRISLTGQTDPHTVESSRRIFGVLIGLVMNGGAWLSFLACCLERRKPAFPERIPIYVHTYFIRRPVAEYAIQKPDRNLTRLSPP